MSGSRRPRSAASRTGSFGPATTHQPPEDPGPFARRLAGLMRTDLPGSAGRSRAGRQGGLPWGVWAAVLLGLVLIQVTVLTFLPVAWATPDLVLIVVLGLAHHRGAVVGGLLGAWAGLLLDVVPPAMGPFAGWILVLGVAGLAHGHIVATRRPGPLLAMLLLAVSAAAATALHALVLWFGAVPVAVGEVTRAALATGGWTLLLAPIALMLTGGRVGAYDPHADLRDPTLLEAVTPGWVRAPAAAAAPGTDRTPPSLAPGAPAGGLRGTSS